MADDPFSRLPALGRVVALARSLKLDVEPYYTYRKHGDYRYAFPQKKKLIIDGLLLAVSTQRACWASRPDKPTSLNITQVHAKRGEETPLTPRVLAFDLQLPGRPRNEGRIWFVTRRTFFHHFPSGHANIPTGPRTLPARSPLDWDLCEGGDALIDCLLLAKKEQRVQAA